MEKQTKSKQETNIEYKDEIRIVTAAVNIFTADEDNHDDDDDSDNEDDNDDDDD